MPPSSLTDRLAEHVALHGSGGRLSGAKRRAAVSRALYEDFADLRGLLHAAARGRTVDIRSHTEEVWCDMAAAAGVLTPRGRRFRPADNGARAYLGGGWLEELVALALAEAGCSDVRFAQMIRWRAPDSADDHFNEVDALGVKDGRLVLVSCKATATDLLERSRGEDRMFDAMLELSYWNAHFGARAALPVFVTTTDFYDEDARAFRSPRLMERARVLGLHVLTADFSTYAAFADKLAAILADR